MGPKGKIVGAWKPIATLEIPTSTLLPSSSAGPYHISPDPFEGIGIDQIRNAITSWRIASYSSKY